MLLKYEYSEFGNHPPPRRSSLGTGHHTSPSQTNRQPGEPALRSSRLHTQHPGIETSKTVNPCKVHGPVPARERAMCSTRRGKCPSAVGQGPGRARRWSWPAGRVLGGGCVGSQGARSVGRSCGRGRGDLRGEGRAQGAVAVAPAWEEWWTEGLC